MEAAFFKSGTGILLVIALVVTTVTLWRVIVVHVIGVAGTIISGIHAAGIIHHLCMVVHTVHTAKVLLDAECKLLAKCRAEAK